MTTQGYTVSPNQGSDDSSFLNTLQSTKAQILLLIFAIGICFGHTLNAPFYLDDFSSIRENFSIRDIGNLGTLYAYAGQRIVGYFTFALNYRVHGYDLMGYHLVNITIHILASVVSFLLTRALLRIDNIASSVTPLTRQWLPLLVALLFALHPLQIQAVTYIVQRSASLTALFYLASVLFYVYGRGSQQKRNALMFFALCGLSAAAAVFTKQNAVTIPVSIVLLEIAFFGLRGRKLIVFMVTSAALATLTVAAYYFFVDSSFFQTLDAATQETTLVSRAEYLAIQMGVLWGYIVTFVLPLNLRLEYDVRVSSFSELSAWVYALGHLVVLALAAFAINKRPLIAFSILFYYLAHVVESGVIPIRDFAFEHRTYLPNFGLALLLGWVLLDTVSKVVSEKTLAVLLLSTVVIFGSLTWLRNAQWADPEAFLVNETRLSPNLLRPWNMLGEYYLRQRQNEEAAAAYEQGAKLLNIGVDRQNNTQIVFYENYASALERTGRLQEALNIIAALNISVLPVQSQSKLYTQRGTILALNGQLDAASEDFERARSLLPSNIDAQLGQARVHYMRGQFAESKVLLLEVIDKDPYHANISVAHILLDAIAENE